MSEHKHNKPYESFKDGAVKVSLWEQTGKQGQSFLTASVGKLYKDPKPGQWREGRSFTADDLLKLQALSTQVRESMQRYRSQQRGNEQPALNMAQQRDAVMSKATDTPTKGKDTPAKNGPGHAPAKTGHNR